MAGGVEQVSAMARNNTNSFRSIRIITHPLLFHFSLPNGQTFPSRLVHFLFKYFQKSTLKRWNCSCSWYKISAPFLSMPWNKQQRSLGNEYITLNVFQLKASAWKKLTGSNHAWPRSPVVLLKKLYFTFVVASRCHIPSFTPFAFIPFLIVSSALFYLYRSRLFFVDCRLLLCNFYHREDQCWWITKDWQIAICFIFIFYIVSIHL